MNKAQLVEAISVKSGLAKADAKKALDAFIDSTSEALKSGDRVSMVGFGSFSLIKRNERTGRNPQSGVEITIPAKAVVKFKPGRELAVSVQ